MCLQERLENARFDKISASIKLKCEENILQGVDIGDTLVKYNKNKCKTGKDFRQRE